MVDKLPAALQMEMETEHLPRYNMRRAASRPPPSARTRVLAKPQTESTLVQTRPSGAAPQINDVVVALVQAAAAIAKEVAATGPEPLVAAVDIKHADLQQLVSSDLLLTLMPEAEPEVDAAVKDLDVESRPFLSVDADASPLDAKPCVGRTSPTDVISAATGWSVPSRSCAEPLTPILAPRASEQCKRWTPLIAHSFPKTVAPTPPASPLRLVAHVSTRKISFPKTVAPTPQASPLRLAHVSTRKIRTVAWEEHSKPKHVLDEDVLREGQAAATKHVSAADSGVELPWSFWQASTADVELMLLEEHHALLSPTQAPHSGRESPLNLKLVSDPHSSDLAKFMSAELEPSASHPSPTFIGHNFMDELSYSPAKPAQVTCSALVQAAKDKSKAAAEQARAATGPLKAVKAVATGPLKVAKAEQAKAAFCTLSKALQGNHDVVAKGKLRTSQYRGVSKRDSGRWTARMKQNNKEFVIGRFDTELAAAQAYDKARLKYGGHYGLPVLNFPIPKSCDRTHRPPPSPKPPSIKASPVASLKRTAPSPKRKATGHEAAGEAAGHEAQADDLWYRAAEDYVHCRLADGCILAERHAGLCIIPEPEGRRNRRAAPPPPSLRAQQKRTPVDEIERIRLKLTGMDTWVASS